MLFEKIQKIIALLIATGCLIMITSCKKNKTDNTDIGNTSGIFSEVVETPNGIGFLKEFKNFISENGFNVYDISVISGSLSASETVTEANPCQNSYSVAKAFCVHAVGILYDRGVIDLKEKITDILKDDIYYSYDKRWDNVTVHDAMSHKIGLKEGFLDIDCFDATEFGKDYLKYILETPFEIEPCTKYVYTDAAYYLVARIVEKKTGEPLDKFLYKELFYPAKFREVAWTKCPLGHVIGATGLYIRSEDAVKLPAIYSGQGIYNGRRYVSEDWVKIVEENNYEFSPVEDTGWRSKGGMRGQMVMYSRDKNIAVAWHGYCCDNKKMTAFVTDYFKN